MMENGIKPLYVFDGKPPDMKSGEVKSNGYPLVLIHFCVVGKESREEGYCRGFD